MNTKIVQKCGCYEGDCVEILGLEAPLYACFTCGYAGVTPSGADNPHENEVHVHDLLAEVKRLLAELKEWREECEAQQAYARALHGQLVRATKWAYQQFCYDKSKMEHFDNHVWGEQE